MKAGQKPHATGMRVVEQQRHRRGWGALLISIMGVVSVGVPCSQAVAEVYTGTNAYGIRWYSDKAPVQGRYQVVPSSIPRLEAEPPVVSTPTNMAVEGDATATPKRKPKVKANALQKQSRRKQSRQQSSQQQPSQQKAAMTSATKSRVKSSSAMRSLPSTMANASRSKSARSLSSRNTNLRSSSQRKPRRTVMSQRERQAAALQRRCQRYDLSLRKIQSELRAGYRAAKGRKLRQRRKELQAMQFAECPIR